MVMATNQGMFTNQSSAPSSGFVYVVGNRTFNTAEEAKQYLARNPGAGTISRIPFQNVTGPTTSGPFNVPTTPTGQQRGGGMMQNITTTAPTKQAPIIVGTPTPTSTTRRTAGDTGPIIANPGGQLSVPTATTKTSAPTKQAPIVIPTSDPTKTTRSPYESPPIIAQPGQPPVRQTTPTGPLDPSPEPTGIPINIITGRAEPVPEPVPVLTPEPPAQTVERREPFIDSGPIIAQPEEITTFTFVEGKERVKKDAASYLFNQAQPKQVTVDELRAYFNDPKKVNRLPEVFGTFDNYLAYMTEREQLIQSGEYSLGNWGESRQGLDETQLMILEGEDLWQSADPNDPSNPQYIERVKTLSQKNEYERWINSDVNKALLEKYGVSPTVYSNSGDKFQWNGSAYVKTVNVSNKMSVGDIAKLGFSIALSVIGTPALASALAPSAAAGSTAALAANAAASSIINSATQLLTTGSLDIKDALQAGATSVLTSSALNALEESGIYDSLQEAVGGTTTDQLLDVDGNVIGEIVRDSAGQVISSTGVSANEWYTYATELGGVIQEGQTIAEQLSTVLDVVPDWLYDAGFETAEAINSAFEEAGTGTGTGAGAGDGEGVSTTPVVDGVRDIFAGDAEQVEQVEEPEEDILADTTQEATGLEEGTITEDILGEYLEPIRADITASEQRIISQTQEFLASALANLPPNISQEEVRAIVEEIVANAPQAETLSEEQVDVLVNSAVDAVRVDLETAETERQEIRASQEAGFTQAEQDRQRLMEAIVEARGQTTELSQEMRDLLAQSNQTMQEMFEGTGVDIDELRSGQLSQEEATNALREYTQQEFGAVREELAAGLTEAQQERQELMEAWIAANGNIENLSEEMRDRFEATNQTVEELFAGTNVDIQELRDGQISQAQATDALREYTEQELGVVREELQAGLTEAQQERYELAQDLIEVGGLVENLDAASQERFDELDITVDSLAEEFGVDFDRLEQGLLSAEEATDALQEYAEEEFGAVREDIAGLEERIDANTAQQLEELTGLRSEFLETLSASEAAAIARNQGLSDQLTEQITGVRGETAAQIEGINERLTSRIDEYEQQTGEQLDIAAEERAALGGQLGTLTTNVARVAEDVIRAGGRIEELDEASRQRYEELGLSIDELSLRVGVNLNALSEGMLTQDAALRELIEETTQQTEQSLTERLEEAEQGFATSLSDTEANLLSQITGVEAGVLQQLAEVEGGLQEQFGDQFGQVQEQVAGLGEQVTGIGEQVAGVGEGLGQLGQALGAGLLGLAAAQPTAQEIAAAMPRQPVEFDPFLKGLSPFQPLTPLSLSPVQQKDATSELNKFIGRQTGMLV